MIKKLTILYLIAGATAVVKIKDASQITENTSSNCEEIKIINQPEEGKNIRYNG